MMREFGYALALACGLASAAAAEDAALLLGNERYEELDRVVRARVPQDAARSLDAAGFSVYLGNNLNARDMREQAVLFKAESADADRLVVVLSGRFANDGDRTWFLAADSDAPNYLNVGLRSLSVDSLMRVLAQAPGQAVLFLGAAEDGGRVYDSPLRGGIGRLDIPQGVTVVRGLPGAIGPMVAQAVGTPGADLINAVRRNRQVRVQGFQPATLVMTDQAVANSRDYQSSFGQDQEAWAQAEAADSAQGYSRYIDQFPRGVHIAEAERRLEAIRSEPNRADRLAEEALNLNRAARRAIQRDLNVLDYNTRGIDGIFGPGTRQAIRNWQQQNGLSQTTYLTADQIDRLDGQAARRAAELEAEAERQRLAEERRDRAYWEEIGADGRPRSMRAYLQRYPDGLFSSVAKQELARIEEANRQQARAEERDMWDRARERNMVGAYNTYLRAYPDGRFRQAAEAAIAELEQADASQAAREAAREVERRLGLDAISLRLIEARLQQLGLEPGQVDGQFDRDTRRALRNYQRDRGLERTGYLDQATVSRLLTDVFQ